MALVTLLTDFGLEDSYVAQLKGVILKHCPECQIIDLSHRVRRHSITDGAFFLVTSVPYFPLGTIHLVIVDPGVGSRRLPIIVKCKSATLVGPDNGVLDPAARRLGLSAAYRIREGRFRVKTISPTFHGRDIFAVAAGLLASGRLPGSLGTSVSSIVGLELPRPRISGKQLRCVVLHVDVFGNVTTNAANNLAKQWFHPGRHLRVESTDRVWEARCARTYSDVHPGELTVLQGSQGYVEVAAREDNASELIGLKVGDELGIGPAN